MRILLTVIFCAIALGCSGKSGKERNVLSAPLGTKPEAAAQVEKGNALFASRDFAGAEQAFRQAIVADAGLAEAHYNLALTLDRAGRKGRSQETLHRGREFGARQQGHLGFSAPPPKWWSGPRDRKEIVLGPKPPRILAMGRRRRDFSPEEFGTLVEQALADLPPPYARLARDVSVVVEEEPPPEVLEDLELESADDLLGLYQGLSLAQESFFQTGGQQPPRIAIYRGPILRLCETAEDVRREVLETVVHELGHHVGLGDDEMPY